MAYRRFMYNHEGTLGHFVQLILQSKSLNYSNSPLPDINENFDGKPVLNDAGYLIVGCWPIIEYLNDRYPEPNLCLLEPSHKAYVRMFVSDTIRLGHKGSEIEKERLFDNLTPLLNPNGFLLGPQLTLLDLAVVPIAPDTNSWNAFKDSITERIKEDLVA